MANDVVQFNPNTLPAFAKKAELSPLAKALAGGGGGGKRISIKGGVFRLLVDGEEVAAVEDRHLDVVIVNAAPKIGRTYYEGKYKEGEATAPSCWSSDGDKPDATVQFPQSKTCATCEQNVKGSGEGDSRACRYSQRLAVVLANDMEGEVMQLQVPAKSLFGKEEGANRPLQAYAKWLAAQHVNPDMVITRLKFDTKAESPKLFFKPMRWLTEDEWEVAQTQAKTPDALSAITMTVSQTDKVAAKDDDEEPPVVPPKAAKAKAKPQVADEDDEPPAPAPKAAKANGKAKAKAEPDEDEEEAVEPTKRAGKAAKPEAAPSTPKLKSLVDAWGDDD